MILTAEGIGARLERSIPEPFLCQEVILASPHIPFLSVMAFRNERSRMLHGLIRKLDVGLCVRSDLAPIASTVNIKPVSLVVPGLGLRKCEADEIYSEGL